jgi:hypothetical protein
MTMVQAGKTLGCSATAIYQRRLEVYGKTWGDVSRQATQKDEAQALTYQSPWEPRQRQQVLAQLGVSRAFVVPGAELAASEQLSVFGGFRGHLAHRFEEFCRRRSRGALRFERASCNA